MPFNVGGGNVGPPEFPPQVWWEWQLNGAVGEEGSRQVGAGGTREAKPKVHREKEVQEVQSGQQVPPSVPHDF